MLVWCQLYHDDADEEKEGVWKVIELMMVVLVMTMYPPYSNDF
jgi:hypothetical protein